MAKRIPKGIKQREFAQKLIDRGKSRMEVVNGLVEKMGMTKGYATTMVYRWFVGEDFRKAPKVVKTASQTVTKKTPGKKVAKVSKAASADVSAKKKTTTKKAVTPKASVKEAAPKSKKSAGQSRQVNGVDVFDTSKKPRKSKTAAERTTEIADQAAKTAKKKVADAKAKKGGTKVASKKAVAPKATSTKATAKKSGSGTPKKTTTKKAASSKDKKDAPTPTKRKKKADNDDWEF